MKTAFFDSPQELALLRIRHSREFWELMNWRAAPERQLLKLARSLPENHRRALAIEQIAPLIEAYVEYQGSIDAVCQEAEGAGDWRVVNQLLDRVQLLCGIQMDTLREAEAIARDYGFEFEIRLRPDGAKYKEVVRLCTCT